MLKFGPWWQRVLFLEIALVVLSVLLGCFSTTTTKRDVFTRGVVPAGGAPASAGQRAAPGQVSLTGGVQQRIDQADPVNTGSIAAETLLHGAIHVGVTDAMEIHASVRGADAEALATGSPNDDDPNWMGAWGFGLRHRLVDTPHLSLDFNTGLEIVAVPYQRKIITERTTTVVDADEEGGVVIVDESGPFLEGALYNRRATLSGHLGLQGGLELGVARLIFGGAVARTPSVIGEQSVTTTCEGIGLCDGPGGEDEVPVVRHIALFTLWGGVEVPLSQHFALLGTYHNSATSHEKSQSMNNQGFNLSLKLTF